MSDCLVPSYHPPASSMQTLAPACDSTCAATPPPAPEPTTITSYDFGVAFVCAMPTILRQLRHGAGGGTPGHAGGQCADCVCLILVAASGGPADCGSCGRLPRKGHLFRHFLPPSPDT